MTTRHRSPARGPAAAVVLAGLLVAVLAGCGSDAGTGTDGDTRAQVSAGTVDGFADLFADHRADYERVDTPAALAARSTLVVQGRITEIDEGRVFGVSATDPVASSSIVLEFAVTQVLNGGAPAGDVYVELPAPGQVAAEVFDQVAPKTRDAVLYLTPAATAADTAIVDPDAGRPAGQPLYQPVTPQGFVIEDSTTVVQVLAGVEFPGASLRDFLPAATPFPKAQRMS